jgi:hypothetical protein
MNVIGNKKDESFQGSRLITEKSMVKRSFSPSKIQSINLGGRNYTK